MIERSLGVHAEPITFGFKMALWVDECERNLKRLDDAIEMISYGRLSGGVGTYANIDPFVEEYVCKRLGLKPAKASTQRDSYADFLLVLAIIASSLEKFATKIRNLQRTEIREVEERVFSGQNTSSAIPHGGSSLISEMIAGLAPLVRAKAYVALENVAIWHERELTHSSIERVIVPDTCILVDYMVTRFKEVMEGLVISKENMKRNLDLTHGLIYSQRVILELINKGLKREEAHEIVQRCAMRSWSHGLSFKEVLKDDIDIRRYLSSEEIDGLFDIEYYLRNLLVVFDRMRI